MMQVLQHRRKAFVGGGGGPTLIASLIEIIGPPGTTAGSIDTSGANFLVAYVTGASAINLSGDSYSNTWVPLTQIAGGLGLEVRMFYCAAPSVGPGHTFDVNGGIFMTIAVDAWSGIAASPYDGENGTGQSSGLTLAPGSVTPSQNNSLLVTGLGADSFSSVITIDGASGFTISNNSAGSGGSPAGVGTAMAYKIITDGSAQNPLWSFSAAADSCAVIAAFKY